MSAQEQFETNKYALESAAIAMYESEVRFRLTQNRLAYFASWDRLNNAERREWRAKVLDMVNGRPSPEEKYLTQMERRSPQS